MKFIKEQLQKAAQDLNALGFEPAIDVNNNVDERYLEMVITGRVYSLISDVFIRNKALAIKVFIDMMTDRLSNETLKLLRNLMENCNVREVKKDQLFEVKRDQLYEPGRS